MPALRVTSNSPWHVVFVLDDSGSMAGAPSVKLNEAIDAMIEEMRLLSQGTKPYFRIAMIIFGTSPRLVSEIANEQSINKATVTSLTGNSGSTDIAGALAEAMAVLQRNPGKITDFEPFVFLLTDGHPDNSDLALACAQKIKDLEIAAGRPRLITVGLGNAVNMSLLELIASNKELAKHLAEPADLIKFFPQIGTMVSGGGGAQAVEQAIIDV